MAFPIKIWMDTPAGGTPISAAGLRDLELRLSDYSDFVFSTAVGDIATDVLWAAAGDLVVGTGSNSAARLGVGANGFVLVADSSQSGGMRWFDLAGVYPDLSGTYQAKDTDLTVISALAPADNDFLQRKAGAWTNRTIAQVLTDLGLGALYQPLDSDLTALAALTTTSFGRALLELANAAAGRTALGLVIGTDVQAFNAGLASIAALTTTSFGRSTLTLADAAALRTLAGLGTAATQASSAFDAAGLAAAAQAASQPLDSDLTSIASGGTVAFGRSLLLAADAAALRVLAGVDLSLLAVLASPAFTGNPTAPTQTAGNNSTRIATTAYVDTGLALRAPLASPALTGTPTAPTPSSGDNSTKVATTAYVDAPVVTTVQAADYTLVLADQGTVVEGTKATAQIVTVPPAASVAFPIGTIIEVCQMGAGQITITAGAGVTLRTAASLLTRAQYASAFLRKRATNEWVVGGDLA